MWVSLLWRRAGLPTLAKVLPHGLGVSLEVPFGVAPETRDFRGFPSAPERTRTSTDQSVHKALNLARLPIPPQALGAASIAAGCRVESVLRPRYIDEHMFDLGPAGQTDRGVDGWT